MNTDKLLEMLLDAIDYSFLQNDGSYDKTLTYPVIDKIQYIKEQLKNNEPICEDLEEAARQNAASEDPTCPCEECLINTFKKGAKWKEGQLEKKRLEHYDAQTKEEKQREYDFVMGIIKNEHRIPTFDDAIKYGMRLQKEQMMANAIDAEVLENYDGKVIEYDETILDKKLSNCKVFDKVKVIVVKEENYG